MNSDYCREVARRLRTEVSEGECIDYAVFRIVHDVMGVEDATVQGCIGLCVDESEA